MLRLMPLKLTIAGVLVVLLSAMVACERHETFDVAAPQSPPAPDIVDGAGAAEAGAYLPGNPYHEGRMQELLDRPAVSAAVERFAARDLQPAPEQSITITGRDEETDLRVTLIAFHGDDRSAMIACYEVGDQSGVSPVEFSTGVPAGETGWRPFIGEGWYATPQIPGGARTSQNFQPFDWWDWGFFGRCMAERAPEIAVGCALTCTYVPGYWHCFIVCTATEALSATIRCMWDMYRRGRKEIKKE